MNVKKGFLHLILVVTIGCTVIKSAAQMPGERPNPWEKQNKQSSRFTCQVFPMPAVGSDSVLLRFYIKIPYSSVQFVRRDSLYSASLDLSVHIQNPKGEMLFGKIVKRNLSVNAFRKTLDPGLALNEIIETKLAPGSHPVSARIELDDAETAKPMSKIESIAIPEYFSKPIVLTEPLFFHGNPRDASAAGVFPDIPPVRFAGDSLYYATVWIASKSAEQQDSERTVGLFWSITKEQRSRFEAAPLFKDSMVVALKERIQQVVLRLNQKCDFGRYSLQITATDGEIKSGVQSTFVVRWGQQTTNPLDFGMLVNTLVTIMSAKEVDDLKALTPEAQKIAVRQFWKERDPTQGTPENELEEEYYRRVEYINAHFSTRADGGNGWQTDRGRIYLIYGTPTEILQNPSLESKPKSKEVEIWYYQNIQKRFVFEDVAGMGDYRLTARE